MHTHYNFFLQLRYNDFKGEWKYVQRLKKFHSTKVEKPDWLDWSTSRVGTLIIKGLNLLEGEECNKELSKATEIVSSTFTINNFSMVKIAYIYSMLDFRELINNITEHRSNRKPKYGPQSLIDIQPSFVVCFGFVTNSSTNFQILSTENHFDDRDLHLERYIQKSPCLSQNIPDECKEYCNWHEEIITNLDQQDLMNIMNYGMPMKKLPLSNNDWEKHMAKKLFENENVEDEPDKIAPASPILFCFTKEQGYVGKNIGLNTNVCDDFKTTPSDIGMVLTKNMYIDKVLKVNDTHETVATKSRASNSNINGKILSQLTLVFDTNSGTHLSQMYPRKPLEDTGIIQFQVHQSKELANMIMDNNKDDLSEPLNFHHGYEYFVDIYPHGQVSTEEYKGLSNDQRLCNLDNEVNESGLFKIYAQKNCRYQCHVEIASKICGCRPWDYIGSSNVSECDVFGRSCFVNAMEITVKSSIDSCLHCPLECDYMKFKKVVTQRRTLGFSSGYFKSSLRGSGLKSFEDFLFDDNRTMLDQGFRNMYNIFLGSKIVSSHNFDVRYPELKYDDLIVVHLSFRQPEVNVISPKYSIFDMIGNFGGQFGLFEQITGASFLGIINLLIISIKLCFSCARHY